MNKYNIGDEIKCMCESNCHVIYTIKDISLDKQQYLVYAEIGDFSHLSFDHVHERYVSLSEYLEMINSPLWKVLEDE